MLILLPPSEGKAAPERGKRLGLATSAFPTSPGPRDQVIAALADLCAGAPEHAARTLGLGPTQADDVRRNARLLETPTARADAIYTGVLYENLDLASLDSAARRRAARWLAITSSLFGMVRPADRIPPYRLAGGVNLPGLGVVSAHWRNVLDPVVARPPATDWSWISGPAPTPRSGGPTGISPRGWRPCGCSSRWGRGARW